MSARCWAGRAKRGAPNRGPTGWWSYTTISRQIALITAATLTAGACATSPDADPQILAEGERQFGRCYACHSLDPEETGLSGPHLAGIVGRPAAADTGFDYSPAMLAAARAGLTWNEPELDRFIADPDSVVAGTSMSPTGMVRADQRAALIAYLKSRL